MWRHDLLLFTDSRRAQARLFVDFSLKLVDYNGFSPKRQVRFRGLRASGVAAPANLIIDAKREILRTVVPEKDRQIGVVFDHIDQPQVGNVVDHQGFCVLNLARDDLGVRESGMPGIAVLLRDVIVSPLQPDRATGAHICYQHTHVDENVALVRIIIIKPARHDQIIREAVDHPIQK
jgi:hypothetical protein